MKNLFYLIVLITLTSNHSIGQNLTLEVKSKRKTIVLKETRQHFLMTNWNLKNQIVSENPLADTSRQEFSMLTEQLRNRSTTKPEITAHEYNAFITRYNNTCQIIDFVKDIPIPSIIKNRMIAFYRNAMFQENSEFFYTDIKKAFKKLPGPYILIKTGDRPYVGNENVMISQHNHIEEILKEISSEFPKLSKRQKSKYLRAIKLLNPWIQEFKQGVNYNTLKKNYIADDEELLLFPANQLH